MPQYPWWRPECVRAVVLSTRTAVTRGIIRIHRFPTLLDHQAWNKEHRDAGVGKHAFRRRDLADCYSLKELARSTSIRSKRMGTSKKQSRTKISLRVRRDDFLARCEHLQRERPAASGSSSFATFSKNSQTNVRRKERLSRVALFDGTVRPAQVYQLRNGREGVCVNLQR